MKQARKEDRRVARTKQAISHALVALISKRGFEDLTIDIFVSKSGSVFGYNNFEKGFEVDPWNS